MLLFTPIVVVVFFDVLVAVPSLDLRVFDVSCEQEEVMSLYVLT